jgi:hypothetical protein
MLVDDLKHHLRLIAHKTPAKYMMDGAQFAKIYDFPNTHYPFLFYLGLILSNVKRFTQRVD